MGNDHADPVIRIRPGTGLGPLKQRSRKPRDEFIREPTLVPKLLALWLSHGHVLTAKNLRSSRPARIGSFTMVFIILNRLNAVGPGPCRSKQSLRHAAQCSRP